MKTIWFAALLALFPAHQAIAWGQEGHSVVAEIAQRRLSPQAAAAVARLLGRGHSLASVASWADDVRDARPDTSRWHFVDIPLASDRYVAAEHCAPSPQGDCAIAELDRLKSALRCGRGANTRLEALKFAVHVVGDLHQPLHTVDEQRGGNAIPVQVQLRGLVCSQACKAPLASNFHLAWDSDLIHAAVWDWGAYVDRLESGWLKSGEARTRQAAGGRPVDWALETHAAARTVWNLLPPNRVIDDDYFRKVLPTIDRQLGLAGLRLARFLNEAYGSKACPARY
jgi:hypothetical protein